MNILTVKGASEKWGISQRRVCTLCEQGRIPGAQKIAGAWLLPPDSEKPSDARVKSKKYVNWRNNATMTNEDYDSNVKNVKGTFAVEGMGISNETIFNMKRMASGETTYNVIIEELKEKYTQRM